MIKYHGTPITPKEIFYSAMPNLNALISFAHSSDVDKAFKICNKVCLDNGAFSFWTKNKKVDWNEYYKWVEKYPNREFHIIPDVIDGKEKENDLLLETNELEKGIPVWHIAESFDRLKRLLNKYEYIALGSSGEYSELGTTKWHNRMNEVMQIVCNKDGIPQNKLHMLRCLNPKIFTKYPFFSGDSTNLARNHHRDGWENILNRIEKYNSPKRYNFKRIFNQGTLF